MVLSTFRRSWLASRHPGLATRRLVKSRLHHQASVHIEMNGTLLVSPPGLHLRCYSYTGQLSANVAALVRVLAKPGGRFIDGGSFVGQHAQHAVVASGGACEVLAFEPDSRARHLLRRNLITSGTAQHIAVSQAAISDQNGRASFLNSDVLSTSHIELGLVSSTQGDTESVETVGIRELLESWNPTFIKLDLEGHEPRVLASLVGSDELPPMIVEANPGVRAAVTDLPGQVLDMAELFPGYTRFSNLSDDVLLVPENFTTPGFLADVRRELIHMLETPSVRWVRES